MGMLGGSINNKSSLTLEARDWLWLIRPLNTMIVQIIVFSNAVINTKLHGVPGIKGCFKCKKLSADQTASFSGAVEPSGRYGAGAGVTVASR